MRRAMRVIIPVALLVVARSKGNHIERGPWHLGNYSLSINVIAIAWVIFLSIVLSIPDDNRAGKTLLAVTLLLGLWYGLYERKRFACPAWLRAEARTQ